MSKALSPRDRAFSKYLLGFALSALLTLGSYFAVESGKLSQTFAVGVIVILALIQVVVQLIYFLHLGDEKRPRWRLTSLFFMFMVLGIVVFGSLWIMSNLNYNSMSPSQSDTYMLNQEGIKK